MNDDEINESVRIAQAMRDCPCQADGFEDGPTVEQICVVCERRKTRLKELGEKTRPKMISLNGLKDQIVEMGKLQHKILVSLSEDVSSILTRVTKKIYV